MSTSDILEHGHIVDDDTLEGDHGSQYRFIYSTNHKFSFSLSGISIVSPSSNIIILFKFNLAQVIKLRGPSQIGTRNRKSHAHFFSIHTI